MPTVAEVAWAREKTQNDQHLLALVVWLKSSQRLGISRSWTRAPRAVVEHVRGLLDLFGEVTAEHANRTANWHRGLVRSFMGVKYDSGKARAIAEEAIRRGGHDDEGQSGRSDQRGLGGAGAGAARAARVLRAGTGWSRRSGRRRTPRHGLWIQWSQSSAAA